MPDGARVLITTVPFGEVDDTPLRLLRGAGIDFTVNPLGRKLKPAEAAEMVRDYDIVIAGTEPITDDVMARAPRLKLISRVGVGLDSVDLLAARRRGIGVSYTADAPAAAVAELTIGLIIDVLRSVSVASASLRAGRWDRLFGRRIAECTVGVVGMGRIGRRVVRHLSAFGGRVLVCDRVLDEGWARQWGATPATFDEILRESDVVTLHVPLAPQTRGMIGAEEIARMRPEAVVVNTARGGVVDEAALLAALRAGRLAGAAVDVFEEEPYHGPLAAEPRCLVTPHLGSMSRDCRARMEIEATEEAIRFARGEPLQQSVPPEEYAIREG
ncbi:MAG: phosphoglycerate dehydrogenase [Gemmatimonadaceae bacterium]|nr:phosphoglycerate dehydrogenase [Gemmatimonadaceae bacterium]NUO93179.1 phosphoglycerate dehydrogenase [Gemmatimonadaceae bacterium]NUP54847.1 phosphoglycerate dehydrogenase [Gemmatimonadaceae bacterium]NUP71835.1 phosphoglycerate dehydrogenase [Gemmatimonadaceae bacterium]NUR32989.1 phosphoglycerate dehydrogenase [Gemmatimonadaceae bacterium]